MATEIEIYIDGRWLPKSEAKVSVFDHGFLYGDGVFEGIRAYDGHVFRLKQHLRRLERSAKLIQLKIPASLGSLEKLVKEALRRNGLRDAYIRLVISRGVGDLGLDPFVCKRPTIVLVADRLQLFPEKFYQVGLPAIVAKRRRTNTDALDPSIKSCNYLNNILAKVEAIRAGVPEAIMLNAQGDVCECTGDNIFVVKGNTIITPPVSAGVLVGITRSAVFDLVKKTKYKLVEKLFKPTALFKADEIFFTGTAAEVIPVSKIDGRRIGKGKPGPVTLDLINRYHALIRSEAAASR